MHAAASGAEPDDAPVTVARVATQRGELALRRRGDRWEIVSNGVFLMDTSDGRSERLLVNAALDRCAAASPHLLIGGLGAAFSLVEAVRRDAVGQLTVVEIEPALIDWHRDHLWPVSGRALADPRTRVVCADLVEWIATTTDRYDAICLDIDNGPDWTVTADNARLYRDAGLRTLRRRLRAGGVLSVWSAHRVDAFERRLRRHFGGVERLEVPVRSGDPDVVYLARLPGTSTRAR